MINSRRVGLLPALRKLNGVRDRWARSGRADSQDGSLGEVEVLAGGCLVEQEIEEALQIGRGRQAEADIESHSLSCLRLASSLFCRFSTTFSAGTELPVAW